MSPEPRREAPEGATLGQDLPGPRREIIDQMLVPGFVAGVLLFQPEKIRVRQIAVIEFSEAVLEGFETAGPVSGQLKQVVGRQRPVTVDGLEQEEVAFGQLGARDHRIWLGEPQATVECIVFHMGRLPYSTNSPTGAAQRIA